MLEGTNASEANVIKLFCLWFADFRTKLECLLHQTGKAYQWQTLQLITKNRNLRTKKFYNNGPSLFCLSIDDKVDKKVFNLTTGWRTERRSSSGRRRSSSSNSNNKSSSGRQRIAWLSRLFEFRRQKSWPAPRSRRRYRCQCYWPVHLRHWRGGE